MATVKIVYTSMTGNTEEIAEALKDTFESKGATVKLQDSLDTKADDFTNYDIAVVATYTYGQGELPDDILEFHEDLKSVDLSGKKFGVIGSGDKSYDDLYCKAASSFEEVFTSIGATKGTQTLKYEFNEFKQEELDKFVSDLLS